MTRSSTDPFDIFRPAHALGGASGVGHTAGHGGVERADGCDLPDYLNPDIDPLIFGLDEGTALHRNLESKQRKEVYAIRTMFFRDLLLAWANPPNMIDQIMGQDRTYIAPDFATHRHDHPKTVKIFDVVNGVLAVSVTPPVSDLDKGNLRWTYSIWQAGDWLRFGVLIQGETRYLVEFDNQHDNLLGMERVWDRNADFLARGPNGLLLEWRFKQPDLYTDFIVRERFVMVARHLHFRLSSMIDALARKIASGGLDPSSEFSDDDEVAGGIEVSQAELSLDGLVEDGSWNIPEDVPPLDGSDPSDPKENA